jgi:hypothetical protein
MHLALVVLALSPSVFEGYIDSISSTLGVTPIPSLVIVSEAPVDEPIHGISPTSRAWLDPFVTDKIFVRKWAVEKANDPWVHYVIAHELCHLSMRHNSTRLPESGWKKEQDRRETEADNCVKGLVTEERWNEMYDGWRIMNWFSVRRPDWKEPD